MEDLPKDVLYSIAMELDCPEVLYYCRTNKKYMIRFVTIYIL